MANPKQCFKCRRILQLSEFYRHPMMGDGHLGKCKDCTKRDAREHRERNLERVMAYDRERHKRPEYIARIEQRRAMFPRQHWAAQMVHRRLKNKTMFRMPCEVCGDTAVDAHHDDYLKPLDVRWLCRKHHRTWHVENGPGANLAGEIPEKRRAHHKPKERRAHDD